MPDSRLFPRDKTPTESIGKVGKRCPRKTRYPDKLSALMALSHMRAKGRSEKRIYRCQHCRGYHTTGRPMQARIKGWPLGLA